MASPLLETKLCAPRPRRVLVPRPRLRQLLDQGTQASLTLVSAPAGFGKTTLLAAWAMATPPAERRTAWLALDSGDDQPTPFWTYVIAALQTAVPGVGAEPLALLESPQPPAIDVVLTTLLNDLNAVARDVVVVLDDYHVIDDHDIHDGVAFLLDHLPAQVHVVIAGRADPALPLARLRARGELVEIRAADLRFTSDEAVAFLTDVMGLDVSAADVAALEARTEGWIAGLQLAGLSLQGRDDVAGFIREFAGDDRYIVDYLVDEVLDRQPEQVRSFLLRTALLDRLSGPLCNAVTGRDDSQNVLFALERDNLFVVALDDKRRWYRYHHLFAEVLRVRMLAEDPDQVATLRRRASHWYEQHGMPAEAIRHALAAEDFPRAADLIEQLMPALQRSRQEAGVLSWLEAVPDELVASRPVLSVGYAWALLAVGEVDGVEGRLRDAERWLDSTAARAQRPTAALAERDAGSAEMVVIDEVEFRRLPAAIASYRAAKAMALGDVAATARNAQRALDVVEEDDHLRHGAAAALLGLASWASGDLEAGHQAYTEATARLRQAGNIADTLGCALVLADIRITQGRLHEAMRTYERALRQASEHGPPALRGTADMYAGMSEIHREWNQLDVATQRLVTCHELGEHTGLPQHRYRWRVVKARIRQARGDLDGALDLLSEAERLYVGDFSPDVRPVAAFKARVWVAQGRLAEAMGWARERGLAVDDDLSYVREFEHLTLARVLLAQATSNRAPSAIGAVAGLLERLLRAAEQGGRTGSVIEILVLQALAHQSDGDIPAALVPLTRALTLAEPEGYVRTFVDEGPPMASLLTAVIRQGVSQNHVRRLLHAFRTTDDAVPASRGLIEPLSERELDVLQLLGTDLDGPAIARELTVSLSTVRTHTKHIYRKLGVNNRRAAVRRAEQLSLSARSRTR